MITTKRLILRPFEMTDVDSFAPICADEEVMRYIGGGAHDKATTKTKLEFITKSYEQDGFGLLALIFKETNELIGFCGLIRQNVDNKDYIELGYRLAHKYWGMGLAIEAALAVKDYAFNELKLKELISIVHDENLRSKQVAKKVGMQLFKQTIYQDIDVEIFAIKNKL